MAVITAALVNELRQKTGLGMMQCKKALTEAEGNLAEAEVILRKTLIGKQQIKGMERTASEGSVFARVSDDKQRGAIIELNSETDFVAKKRSIQSDRQDPCRQNHVLRAGNRAIRVSGVPRRHA